MVGRTTSVSVADLSRGRLRRWRKKFEVALSWPLSPSSARVFSPILRNVPDIFVFRKKQSIPPNVYEKYWVRLVDANGPRMPKKK